MDEHLYTSRATRVRVRPRSIRIERERQILGGANPVAAGAPAAILASERNIVELVQLYLRSEGYQVDVAYDGREALEKIGAIHPDLIVLDLMMPELDGLEVTRRLRQADQKTPVIMLTAKGDDEDKVKGLDLGADDYLAKPFNPKELVARVKAVLRRTQEPDKATRVLTVGNVRVDFKVTGANAFAGSVTTDHTTGQAQYCYTPTAFGTDLAKGKETRRIGDRDYVLEYPIHADYALIKADRADRWGNLTYRKTARNFAPIMAAAAKCTVVQVRETVELGALDPEMVVTPGIFVQRIIKIAPSLRKAA